MDFPGLEEGLEIVHEQTLQGAADFHVPTTGISQVKKL